MVRRWAIASKRWIIGTAALAVFVTAPALPAAPQHDMLVFAAISLKGALDAVLDAYRARGDEPVTVSYAASSTLARQIEQGARADLFISADAVWMDYLAERGLVRAGTRVNVLANRLVLVAPNTSDVAFDLTSDNDLAARLGDGFLAMGDPTHVPAGIYGKAALERLGLWQGVAHRIARADNVRAALMLVAEGEAPLGIVYETDARAESRVRIVAVFPESSHGPILYPAAVLAESADPEAAGRLLAFLTSVEARAIFERFGFSPAM